MQVITVTGESDAGKTTLIKYLFEQLKNSGGEVLFIKNNIGQNYEDFEAVLFWNGKKIGICSIGDAQKYIDNGLEDIVKKYSPLDFYINAVNTDHLTWFSKKCNTIEKILITQEKCVEQKIKQKQNVCKRIILFLEQE